MKSRSQSPFLPVCSPELFCASFQENCVAPKQHTYAAFVPISECFKVGEYKAVHRGLTDTETVHKSCELSLWTSWHSGRNASSREVSQDRVGMGAEGPTGRVLYLHLPFVTDLKLQSTWIPTEFLRSCSVYAWGVTSHWRGCLWVLGSHPTSLGFSFLSPRKQPPNF